MEFTSKLSPLFAKISHPLPFVRCRFNDKSVSKVTIAIRNLDIIYFLFLIPVNKFRNNAIRLQECLANNHVFYVDKLVFVRQERLRRSSRDKFVPNIYVYDISFLWF